VVQDQATGLFWQRSGSPQPLSHGLAQAYAEHLNRQSWGGRRDWRLPTLPELASLLTPEKDLRGLCLDGAFDGRQRYCWSATRSPAGGAYGVLFYPGTILSQPLEQLAYSRAVAGESRGALPDLAPSPELLARGRELLLHDGQRRVPPRCEVEDFLSRGGFFSDVVLSGGPQLYFLPTEEFLTALIRLCRHLGVSRVVEVGAAEGLVAAGLTARGLPVTATDAEPPCCSPYGVPVHRADHLAAVAAFQPELVFWCWPPLGSRAPEEIIRAPGLKFYLEVGDGGFASGAHDLVPRYRGRYLATLSRLGYTRLDVGPYRHNRCFLFKAGGS
jgi:hypothetical protein